MNSSQLRERTYDLLGHNLSVWYVRCYPWSLIVCEYIHEIRWQIIETYNPGECRSRGRLFWRICWISGEFHAEIISSLWATRIKAGSSSSLRCGSERRRSRLSSGPPDKCSLERSKAFHPVPARTLRSLASLHSGESNLSRFDSMKKSGDRLRRSRRSAVSESGDDGGEWDRFASSGSSSSFKASNIVLRVLNC